MRWLQTMALSITSVYYRLRYLINRAQPNGTYHKQQAAWPIHPLYNQLQKAASKQLPKIGYFRQQKNALHTAFAHPDGIVVTIKHQGYDMPTVELGWRWGKQHIANSSAWVEYYLNPEVPITRKHQQQQSFYDFAFDVEFLSRYHLQLCSLLKQPETYLEWQRTKGRTIDWQAFLAELAAS